MQVYYQERSGPRNYASNEGSPLSNYTRNGGNVDRDVPFVAAFELALLRARATVVFCVSVFV